MSCRYAEQKLLFSCFIKLNGKFQIFLNKENKENLISGITLMNRFLYSLGMGTEWSLLLSSWVILMH